LPTELAAFHRLALGLGRARHGLPAHGARREF
jgi:hypothetical protein